MQDSDLARGTIGTIFDVQADRFRERECLAYAGRDVRFTFAQLRERVDLVARGLMALGVRKGEHVAIWAPNVPEWPIVQYAAAKIGAILVPLDVECGAGELEFLLRHSETTTLLLAAGSADARMVSVLREILPDVDEAPVGHGHFENLPRFQRLVTIGRQRLPGMLRFDDLFDLSVQIHPDDYRRRTEALDSFDVIMLQYTAGTAGSRKGVMLTHRNVLMSAWHMATGLDVAERDRVCAPIPFAKCVSSIGAGIGSILRGSCLVPLETFEPRAALDAIARQRCTVIQATPSMLSAMIEQPDLDAFDLSSLRTIVLCGAPAPADLVRAAAQRLPAAGLAVAYGLAESAGGVTRSSPGDPMGQRTGGVGRALSHVHVRVVDPDSGEPVPPGTLGELCCRGLATMKGYHKDPRATAQAIDAEGWLHTRDLATADRDGFVTIAGRMGDPVTRDGEKGSTGAGARP